MQKREAHEALRAHKRRQYGLFTMEQAYRCGLTKDDVYGMVRRGEAARVGRGVFRDLAHQPSSHQRLLGTVLLLGPRAFATERSAGWLYAVDGIRPGRPHVGIPHGAPRHRIDGTVHQMVGLQPGDIRRVDGIPCLSPELTVLTLASHLTEVALEDVLVDLSCRRLTSPEQVGAVLKRFARSGRNGVVATRTVVERWDGQSLPGSVKALQLARELVAQGLPEPEFEIEVETTTGLRRVDLGWRDWKEGVEYNSDRRHLTWERRRADSGRTQELAIAGWGITPATQEDIDGHAVRLARAIRSRLAARAA